MLQYNTKGIGMKEQKRINKIIKRINISLDRATAAKEIAKSEAHKPDIPPNLTEDQLYKLYQKLSMAFAFGDTYNPHTFPEFKKSSGY